MSSATQILSLTTRFHDILNKISQILEKARNNKRTRRLLRSTLRDLTPLVKDINQYNQHLNQPRLEINSLIQENVACKCSSHNTLWSKCLSWFGNGSSVVDDSESLTVKDVRETLYKVRKILELINNENFEQKLNENGGAPFKSSFGVPENPEFTVGLDIPFTKLKIELLKDGSSTLVLTGLGGLGKTTLATKLCWDEHVKAKFKENMIFVTFSKTPMLKIIIERLFEHCGYYPVSEFQTDEDAVNKLGLLLKKVEGSPLLLVLDDVWPNSETLIEKLQFQISDFKILVTSRVAFQRFSTTCVLKPLVHEDALILFHHYAQMEKDNSNILDKDLIEKVVKNCKGLPLAIKVTATSLRNRPYDFWRKIGKELSQGHSILDSNTELLSLLQKILDVLEDNPILKECFKDLALFPEDHRIPVVALIYMWTELYELDDNGIEAMEIINKLSSMNLAHVSITRKNASDADDYNYNNHFITLHDLVRDLGIYQSTKEPIEQRKRMVIDMNENKREWCIGEKQQGLMIHILSKLLSLCVKQNPQQLDARILSVSTGDTSASDWSQVQTTQAEVLILNLHTKQYLFPESMEKMSKLKVLIITNYGFHHSELNNFELLDSLHNLTRIRLERISIPSFGTLKNLKKLSLYMCNTSLAFEKGNILISDAFPNLEELNIDYCKDLLILPNAVCDITPLKKLSVTNCHKLSALPQDIGKLENLELLRLSSCTDLEVIPNSIGKLLNLRHLDISNCISLSSLPEEFGNLCNLRNLYMSSCASCELPFSVVNLLNLKAITCDEETAASWEAFQPMLPNMKIEVPHVDVNLNWLR
ncbi:probable disease resistance protein At5g66900 [Vicia villosa]|uniref:probable disease resistance protein At5g66900 n=1 Tax=Vicia villosa TaxID=3911 RepID=UPI00273BB04B|nr:probable disease resistance protein At5g66900 [Vicia villosa]